MTNLSVLPCNKTEFGLTRIQIASERIRHANNQLWHPEQQEALLNLVEKMATSLENTANWADHLVNTQPQVLGE